MNKLLRIIILGLLMMLIATVASANEPQAAFVLHDDWCLIPDADGIDSLFYIEECAILVETNSTTGVKMISGHAYLPEDANVPEKPIRYNYKTTDGFECWWDENITTPKYQFTVNPTGRVDFYCLFLKYEDQ